MKFVSEMSLTMDRNGQALVSLPFLVTGQSGQEERVFGGKAADAAEDSSPFYMPLQYIFRMTVNSKIYFKSQHLFFF